MFIYLMRIPGSGTTKTTSGDQPTQPGPGSTTAPPGRETKDLLGKHLWFQIKLVVEKSLSSRAVPSERLIFYSSLFVTFASKAKPEIVGKYSRVGSDSTGRIVYKKDSTFLHYAVDVAYKFEAWIFSSSADDLMGEVRSVLLRQNWKEKVVNEDKNSCVDATASSWEMLVDSDWQQDETATVTCARWTSFAKEMLQKNHCKDQVWKGAFQDASTVLPCDSQILDRIFDWMIVPPVLFDT